jgi:CTP:molybdopterin cytidylyltransferase MocA
MIKNNRVFILLAGGQSSRMGSAKGLLTYQDSFWILAQLKRISKAKISCVYIGLGHNAGHYFDAIPWLEQAMDDFVSYLSLKVKVIINPAPELGSFATLQSVIKEVASGSDILINPIDVPILNHEELNRLIETQNTVVFPTIDKRSGHPIKLEAKFWQSLVALDLSDKDARLDFQVKKLTHVNISRVPVTDSVVIKNINTPLEWLTFINESSVLE